MPPSSSSSNTPSAHPRSAIPMVSPSSRWTISRCRNTGRRSRPTSLPRNTQTQACSIESVKDDMLNEGGIFDLVTREARIFKYGSGTGTNFSSLRAEGEKVSGGGVASGVMSFLKINDRAASAVKSGGTTRRAAKMVILDIDHPDIET